MGKTNGKGFNGRNYPKTRRRGGGGFNRRQSGGFGMAALMGGQPVRQSSIVPRQIQSVPNSWRTTLVHTCNWSQSSGVASSQYGAYANSLQTPYLHKGGSTNLFPNATGGSPATLLNWLTNSTTSTGLYINCTVRKSRFIVTVMPGAIVDQVAFVFSIILGGGSYPNAAFAADGPNSVSKLVQGANSRNDNTVSVTVTWPKLFGLKWSAYKPAALFQNGTPVPIDALGYMELNWNTPDSANLVDQLVGQIRAEHEVEFWNRADTEVEDFKVANRMPPRIEVPVNSEPDINLSKNEVKSDDEEVVVVVPKSAVNSTKPTYFKFPAQK